MNVHIRPITDFDITSNELYNDRSKLINKQTKAIIDKLLPQLASLQCAEHLDKCFCNISTDESFFPHVEGACCDEFSQVVLEEYRKIFPNQK